MNSSPRSEVKFFFRYGQIGIILLMATILFAASGGKAGAERIEVKNNSSTDIQAVATPSTACTPRQLRLPPGASDTLDFGVCTISAIALTNAFGTSHRHINCTLFYSGMGINPTFEQNYDNPPRSNFTWNNPTGDMTAWLSLTCEDK